jgi:uncharacterized phage protein (TIGR02218 family)
MATHTVIDNTRYDGTPVECFHFVIDGAVYNYCTGNQQITVDGKVFSPALVSRTTIKSTDNISDQSTVDITIPVDSEVAQAVIFDEDARDVDVTVYRAHYTTDDNTFDVLWKGSALSFGASDRDAVINTGNTFQLKFLGNFNAVYYQLRCDHILYGDRCQADETAHDYAATVDAIDTGTNTITFSGDAVVADALENGEMVMADGTRVGIVENTTTTFKLSYIPAGLAVSDDVTLYDGCNHNIDDCNDKFSNIANYGGFPNIPESNPYG